MSRSPIRRQGLQHLRAESDAFGDRLALMGRFAADLEAAVRSEAWASGQDPLTHMASGYFFLGGVCERSLAAVFFSAGVALGSFRTLPASDAAFFPVAT